MRFFVVCVNGVGNGLAAGLWVYVWYRERLCVTWSHAQFAELRSRRAFEWIWVLCRVRLVWRAVFGR